MEKKETVNEKETELKKKRTSTASKAKKSEEAKPKTEEVKLSKEEETIKALEDEVKQLKEELATSKNAYFKAYADADNMKKRIQAESENVRKYRIQSFASEVLPVMDSMERALAVTIEEEAVANYVKGFEMIYTQLKAILEKEGVTEIEALEKPFDPNYHNALMQEKVEGVESGIVLEVLQKGYMLKDRVLRAALVKVSE